MESRGQRGGEYRGLAGERGGDPLVHQGEVDVARRSAGPRQDADGGLGDDLLLELGLVVRQGFITGAGSLQFEEHPRDLVDDVGVLVLVEDPDGAVDAVQELRLDLRTWVILGALGDLDGREGFRAEEGALARAVRKKAVEEGDQVFGGTIILVQSQLLLGLGHDLFVVVDVGAAEAVDGLLAVPDHDEELGVFIRWTVAEGLFEDFPLFGVGVLRFVDEAGVEVRPNAGAERLTPDRVPERVQEVLDDRVEGQQAAGGLELGDPALDEFP